MAEWKESLESALDREAEKLTWDISDDDKFDAQVKRVRQVEILLEAGQKVETPNPRFRWIDKHADALISAGATIVGIVIVVGGEQLGPMLLNTKAWPFVPKPRI